MLSMQRTFLIIILLGLSWTGLLAQYENFVNKDTIYDPNIATVEFYNAYDRFGMPAINLNSDSYLILNFDEMRLDFNDFFYTIVHCNYDWEKSNLNTLEYLDGFDEDDIRDESFSRTRFIGYNHYSLRLPNRNMRPKVTGNYLLHIYRYDQVKQPILTRRFIVYEPRIPVEPRVTFPIVNDPGVQYQEIDFNLKTNDPEIQNPMVNIKVDVYQNGRWDNPIKGLKANFAGQDVLKFNYVNRVVFSGLREFRFLDLRSSRLLSRDMRDIEETDEGIFVTMETSRSRLNRPYFFFKDINGSFFVENQDLNLRDSDLSAEYINVLFSYYAPYPFYEKEVYLFGKFSDWQMLPKYKMEYSEQASSYVLEVLWKQGWYEYTFSIVDEGAKEADMTISEGGRFETENDYYFFVYYRNPVERFDRIVGYRKMSTIQFE
ncbi:MAG TPA: type IX secretion system plug protein domain-containing protein [Saprospiraceae bacterium]|nr:type IX secretion system plug protein domain-containing protein [Saprospiraceae bacterium]